MIQNYHTYHDNIHTYYKIHKMLLLIHVWRAFLMFSSSKESTIYIYIHMCTYKHPRVRAPGSKYLHLLSLTGPGIHLISFGTGAQAIVPDLESTAPEVFLGLRVAALRCAFASWGPRVEWVHVAQEGAPHVAVDLGGGGLWSFGGIPLPQKYTGPKADLRQVEHCTMLAWLHRITTWLQEPQRPTLKHGSLNPGGV